MLTRKLGVTLPTATFPPRNQQVLGTVSALFPEDVDEFRGIPYATIPARLEHSILRNELPCDEFNAVVNGPKCPQPVGPNNSHTFQAHLEFPSDVTESEFDCLNLFIIRPSQQALKRIGKEQDALPILVWIHGGGFGFGAGTDPMWDPTRIVKKSLELDTPIIVVSINYRLNIFGFLCSSAIVSSSNFGGNFGLQDQHQALRWISRNIKYFGGDSKKITIGGQSAGAASVHSHLLNAKNVKKGGKRLFERAVLMSGSIGCLGPWRLDEAEERWEEVCKELGFGDGAEERLKALRGVSTEKLLEASERMGWMLWNSVFDGVSIRPTEDEGAPYVMFGIEDDGYEEADQQPIEVMIGETNNEGYIFAQNAIQHITSFDDIHSLFSPLGPEIMALYFPSADAPLAVLHQAIAQFASDTMFGLAASRAAASLRLSTSDSQNMLVKEYSVQYGNPFPGQSFGIAHHCVDLIYLFDAFHDFLAEADKKEARKEKGTYEANRDNAGLADEMQRDWIEFIKKGNIKRGNNEMIKVYGHDRVVREESLDAETWVEQIRRFEAIGRDLEGARNVFAKMNKA